MCDLYFTTSDFSWPSQPCSHFFFLFQQAGPSAFIMHSLFLDKGRILLSAKAKEWSTSELFQGNLHNA